MYTLCAIPFFSSATGMIKMRMTKIEVLILLQEFYKRLYFNFVTHNATGISRILSLNIIIMRQVIPEKFRKFLILSVILLETATNLSFDVQC